MRGVRAQMACLPATLALVGCMLTGTQVAAVPRSRAIVPLGTSINPGDTILVGERWF